MNEIEILLKGLKKLTFSEENVLRNFLSTFKNTVEIINLVSLGSLAYPNRIVFTDANGNITTDASLEFIRDTYAVGTTAASGSITVTSDTGTQITGLTIGEWYSIEATGGPWHAGPTPPYDGDFYSFNLSKDGSNFSGQVGYDSIQGYLLTAPTWAAYAEWTTNYLGRVYFQATTTSIWIRVGDNSCSDNTGSLGYTLSTATVGENRITLDDVEYVKAKLGSAIHAATAKTTPVDADESPWWDSATNLLKKITWANIKATLKTYFDTLYSLAAHTHAASAITNTPAGNISSTDVQAAINELDTEKLAAASFVPAGSATELQYRNGSAFGAANINYSDSGAVVLLQIPAPVSDGNGEGINFGAANGNGATRAGGQAGFFAGDSGGWATETDGGEGAQIVSDGGTSSYGGSASVTGGDSINVNAGHGKVQGGDVTSGNGNGGDVYLQPGAGSGSGANGRVKITDPAASVNAILDTSSLATSDKTFTLPNASGTLALTSDIPAAYTDEKAQDAVGGMIADTSTIDLTYTDATPELKADVKTGSIGNTLLADMAQNTIKGRITASTGAPEDLTAANVRTIINVADGAEVNVNADWNAVSGDAQILNKPTIPTQYTDEMAQDAVGGMIADTATIDLTYTDATPELKADVKTDSIGNTLLANMAANTIKGRVTASTGDPEDLTAAQAAGILKSSIADLMYPVGSIYCSVVSTNPNTLFGVGTWVAFGAGKVMVGINAAETEFDTVEETGGEKTHTLNTTEMPTHTHIQDAHGHSVNIHAASTSGGDGYAAYGTGTGSAYGAANNTATNQNAGGGGAHNNLQPYIVVYMWKRTA